MGAQVRRRVHRVRCTVLRAKRGDCVAVVRTERTYYIGQPNTERTSVVVGRVTSTTRDGVVKGLEDCQGYAMGDPGAHRTLIIPADKVSPDDVMRVAREHHWPDHPGQPMPWDTVEALREALRPFLIS